MNIEFLNTDDEKVGYFMNLLMTPLGKKEGNLSLEHSLQFVSFGAMTHNTVL
jgi:hypothetical protein